MRDPSDCGAWGTPSSSASISLDRVGQRWQRLRCAGEHEPPLGRHPPLGSGTPGPLLPSSLERTRNDGVPVVAVGADTEPVAVRPSATTSDALVAERSRELGDQG